MTELSEFGKKRYRNRYANTAELTHAQAWNVPITSDEKRDYAPFNHLELFNRDAAAIIQINLNAFAFGDHTISTTDKTYYLLPSSGMVIEVTDKIEFNSIAILNLDGAADIAIGKVVVMFQNF